MAQLTSFEKLCALCARGEFAKQICASIVQNRALVLIPVTARAFVMAQMTDFEKLCAHNMRPLYHQFHHLLPYLLSSYFDQTIEAIKATPPKKGNTLSHIQNQKISNTKKDKTYAPFKRTTNHCFIESAFFLL